MDASLSDPCAAAQANPRFGLALSIIVPCLNEAERIGRTLEHLAPMRARGAQVIVVDGGSRDATVARARAGADLVVSAPPGRASQMNAGALAARNDVLLFLHADSRLPACADAALLRGLARSGRAWGRFDVAIEGSHPLLRLVAASMNLRSRLTSIATGDQGIFVKRSLFERIGRYRAIALMEDIELTKRLKRDGPPLCLRERIVTSGRRWEKHGVARTIWLMWRLRFAYWRGADPDALARLYATHE
jgi:rSAM/selenodomain-associated transferase 2